MFHLVDHARRAVFGTGKQAGRFVSRSNDEQVPALPALVFLLTFFCMGIALAALSYTYAHLITTLCMVESPGATQYVPITSVEPDHDSPPAYGDEEGIPKPRTEEGLVKTQPVTASLRGTIAHLKERAGFWSRFRGLGVYLVWNFGRSFIIGLLSTRASNPFTLMTAAVIAEIALANVHMTWIHIIISEPSPYRWYQRLPRPALRAFQKIAPSVALWAVTSQLTSVLPMLLTGTFGPFRHMSDPTYTVGRREAYASGAQFFFLFFLTILMFVGLQIPATVAMVRVAASMLPEECETIVPFDRTFGGITTPEIVGGQGKVGIVEAWRTFNGEQRRRLIGTLVKVVAVVVGVQIVFMIALAVEMHLLFTQEQLSSMLKGIHGFARGGAA